MKIISNCFRLKGKRSKRQKNVHKFTFCVIIIFIIPIQNYILYSIVVNHVVFMCFVHNFFVIYLYSCRVPHDVWKFSHSKRVVKFKLMNIRVNFVSFTLSQMLICFCKFNKYTGVTGYYCLLKIVFASSKNC